MMSAAKKQRLLTKYLASDEGQSNTEVTESMEMLPFTSSSTNESVDVHYLRKFLPCWKMLFPLAECEEGSDIL